jgi:hypothetical protein
MECKYDSNRVKSDLAASETARREHWLAVQRLRRLGGALDFHLEPIGDTAIAESLGEDPALFKHGDRTGYSTLAE